MTRLHPAAPAARTLRALVGLGAIFILAVVASGCVGSQPPAPTPDPFVGLADRSDQAFRQGLEAYGQGQFREALTSFEQARTLSPTVDPRIDQMIERTRAAMAPTATPVPPTPTEVPAAPTATPVAMSSQTPDTDLGQRYFGQVTLAVVPGRDADAPAASQFFFQDQIGMHIGGLKQHLRLPFALRVFNKDTGTLVAEVQSEDSNTPTAVPTTGVQALNSLVSAAAAGITGQTATPVASPGPRDFKVARFWDTYVWYHAGGEDPGSYRLELYANGVLTNSFDYTVGTVPVPTPEPTVQVQPTPEAVEAEPPFTPTPSLPTVEDVPPPPPPPPAPTAPARAAQPRQTQPVQPVQPTATPQPTPIPSPTPIPTPSTAYTTQIGGLPAGIDVNSNSGQFYIADASGVIWTADAPTGSERPTLGTPFNLRNFGAGQVLDLAADPTTGYVFASARGCPADAQTRQAPRGCVLALNGQSGALITSIALPGAPTDLRIDPDLGLMYVSIPERQALAEVDAHSGRVLGMIQGLPQITSLAIDPLRHTLYAAHLAGQATVIDVASARVTARVSLTGAGLSSIATARGLAYGVNTATHELAVVEPVSQTVNRFVLSEEPAAVAAAEDSGAVYVLSSRSDNILQIDPTDGTELGKVLFTGRSGHQSIQPSDVQSLRPRLVLNPGDDSLFASLPEAGTLAAVSDGSFPVMARTIGYPDVPDEVGVAEDIPALLQPAAVNPDGTFNARGH
jgi:hypothetical protein